MSSPRRRTLRRATSVGAALVLTAGSLATAVGAVAATPSPVPLTLPSVIPAWGAAAPLAGAVSASQTVYLNLTMRAQDEEAYAHYSRPITGARSPLTVDQVKAQLGGSDASVAAVARWLASAGATSVSADRANLIVSAQLPVSLATSLFGVTFAEVSHAGQTVRVARSEPHLPADLLPLVRVVSGFTESPVHHDHTVADHAAPAYTLPVPIPTLPTLPPVPGVAAPAPAAFFNATPCSTYYGEKTATGQPGYPVLTGDSSTTKPYNPCGYTPAQIRGAYGVTSTPYTGAGVTVGIVDAFDSPRVLADTNTFSAKYGLPAVTSNDVSPPGLSNTPADPTGTGLLDPQGWSGEETLDWEAVHLIAPQAKILYSGAVTPLNQPLEVAVTAAMLAGAQEVTNSYGGTGDPSADDMTAFQAITTTANAMMVGLEYSSGDAADNVASGSGRVVDFPASSDMVTAVGGTGLKVNADNSYGGEYYWGTYRLGKDATGLGWAAPTFSGGGGGGVSIAYAEPTYQTGVVPTQLTQNADTGTTAAGRVVPDVSMLADSTTGMLVGQTQIPDAGPNAGTEVYSEYRIGGTSVASPLFAGMMALADQAAGHSIGLFNTVGYPLLAKHDGAFRDPQVGRSPTGSRLGGTIATPNTTPVLADVRQDYTDTANPNGVPVITSLRTLGNLGTLSDLPGYDDSTGLGTPFAPTFIADVAGAAVTPPASLPEAPATGLLALAGLGTGALALAVVRRRRRSGEPA